MGLLVAAGVLAGAGYAVTSALHHAATVVSQCTAGSGSQSFTLSPDQAQNASIIAAVGLREGLPDHAVTVALATALQESGLVDLTYGDLDSVGLFQQRPSQGWGTRSQLLDPVYASTAFYGRLRQVPGWQTMAVTEAAQAVQLSASPTAYANWEGEARTLAVAMTGEQPAQFTCHLARFSGAAPQPGALEAAATQEAGSGLLGTALTAKTGWTMASWTVAHAWQYHIAQVTFGSWKWTAASGEWRNPGSGPGGNVVSVTYG
jgi:hypothetical protein